jgi:hypothetical protein
MLGVFSGIKDFLKFDAVWIDNNVFRLHYKATLVIFVVSSLLVTSRQYIGDPIDCIVDGVPGGIMDTYCWIHSTYSIPSRWAGKQGHVVPHPGISPHADLNEGDEVKYHKYYQWVCFVLFLQAAFFYIPRYLWKSSEGGKIRMLVQELQEPIITADGKKSQIDNIVKYWSLHRGTHGLYATRFFLCEVLNFANVLGQIYFTDYFLGYEFRNYGFDVMAYSEMEPEDRPDPMAKVFPKVTKCTFHNYGPSGTVEKKDGLCVLPLNIINEKIYIFIWFWLIIISVITGFALVYRIIVLAFPKFRVVLINWRCGKSAKRSDIEAILEPPSLSLIEKIGDWFVLHLIVKNLDVLTVNEIIKQLHKEQEGNNSNTETLKLKPETSQV